MKNNFLASIVPVIGIATILVLNAFKPDTVEKVEVPVYVIYEESFSEEALIEEIKKYNFKHPEIVLAQARLETGNFTSTIFLENNNLFGMKLAYSRPSTALGVNRGHAYYDTWEDSLVDYALYKAAFMRYSSEEKVIDHLGRYYAQDLYYSDKILSLVETIKTEGKF